jgi:hypothetical protein
MSIQQFEQESISGKVALLGHAIKYSAVLFHILVIMDAAYIEV